jgi:hypothetical protein
MADRTLESEWPEYVNSSGVPGTGSKVTAELLDAIREAVKAAIYDPSLDDDPPGIAREVSDARGGQPSLDARLDAIEAIASGGAATPATPGQFNLVPNGNFLIWGDGTTSVPSFFSSTGSPTFAAESARGGADSAKIVGPYVCAMTGASAANRDLYIDLISATVLSTHGSYPLSSRSFAAGIFVKQTVANSIQLLVDDGVSEKTISSGSATTGSYVWISGAVTLAAAPTKLKLIVRLNAATTSRLSGLCAYFADSAPQYIPAPTFEGEFLYAEPGTAVSTGNKFYWKPGRPLFIKEAQAVCASGSGTVRVLKNSASVFTSDIAVTSSYGSVVYPASAALASVDSADELAINVSVSTSMVTPNVRVKYIAFLNPLTVITTQVPV